MKKLDKAIENLKTEYEAQASLYGKDSWQAKETRQIIKWLRQLKHLRQDKRLKRS